MLVVMALFSLSALADETCSTSLYDFRITSNYIEAKGQNEHVRLTTDGVRTLVRRQRREFKALLEVLSNELETDVILRPDEAKKLDRFSLNVADGKQDLIGAMYAKGYDERGQLLVRYMVTENGSYRCQ